MTLRDLYYVTYNKDETILYIAKYKNHKLTKVRQLFGGNICLIYLK